MKIGVVILQYNEYKQTQQLIELLKKMDWSNIESKYIIVDNNSLDGSGKKLQKIYENDKSTIIILNKKIQVLRRGIT